MATLSASQLYLLYSACFAAAFGTILPLFAIYFRDAGLTLFQLALLAFIFEGTILLLELPTGVLADLKGRVNTLRLAAALLTIAGILLVFARSLGWFIAAEILVGIGEAARSGSAEAWISERQQATGEGSELTRLFARRTKYNFGVAFVAMLLGGLVAQLYLPAGWVLFSLLALAGFYFSLLMREGESTASRAIHPRSFWRHLKSGLRTILGSPHLSAILLLLLAGNAASEGVDQFWQVYLTESFGVAALWFGVATATTALILFLTADRLAPWLRVRVGFARSITILAGAGAVLLLIFSLVGTPLTLLLSFILFSVARNLQEPLITGFISEHSPSQTRATVLSTNNLVASAGEMIAALTLGWLAGAAGLRPVFLVGVAVLILGGLGFGTLFHRRRQVDDDPVDKEFVE